jgi:hypothetical protein
MMKLHPQKAIEKVASLDCAHVERETRERVVEVETESAICVGLRAVRAYCAACRLVLSPQMPEAFVNKARYQEDARIFALRGPHLLGQNGDAKTLGLPAWEELHGFLAAPLVARKFLFENYKEFSRETLRGRIRNLLTLPRGDRDLIIPAQDGQCSVAVGSDFINHLMKLDAQGQSRIEVDHMPQWALHNRTLVGTSKSHGSCVSVYKAAPFAAVFSRAF